VLEALLFDLDQTLTQEERPVLAALRATAREAEARYGIAADELAVRVPERARELWRSGALHTYCVGLGISSWEGLWCRFEGEADELACLRAWAPGYRSAVWASALATFGIHDEPFARDLAERFGRERRARHAAFSDAAPALEWARRHYRKLALVTNGASCLQREKLAASGFERYFDVIAVSGEVGVGKPAAPIYRHTIDMLGVPAAAAAMIGDSLERDVIGARAAGLHAVWLNRARRPPPAERPPVEVEIESLQGLPEALARLSSGAIG
jgi:putative hydrolase of the HAD superfamily